MNNMKQFIEKNFTLILMGILLSMWVRSCSQANDITKIKKELQHINDSTYNKKEMNVLLQVEGLKAEKRMIQATDRRIMDVNRQNEIDKEIKVLEDKLK
jgi:hypothetical protein